MTRYITNVTIKTEKLSLRHTNTQVNINTNNTESKINLISKQGMRGVKGDKGDKGDRGDAGDTDLIDFTLIFENQLI